MLHLILNYIHFSVKVFVQKKPQKILKHIWLVYHGKTIIYHFNKTNRFTKGGVTCVSTQKGHNV